MCEAYVPNLNLKWERYKEVTGMVKGMENLPYKVRLKDLGLFSLATWKLRRDRIIFLQLNTREGEEWLKVQNIGQMLQSS